MTADSAYTGFNVVVDRVPESNSVRRRKAIQKGECPHCAVLLAEVARLRLLVPEMERLRLDQARLKQELSEARVRSGEMVLMPGPATARGRVVRRTDAVGVPLAGGLGKVRGETLYARMLRSRGDE